MAREGQFLKLPGGWFGKVEGEGDSATLRLYRTFNNQHDGRPLEEIRLEKQDTNDMYAFLEENDMVWLTNKPQVGTLEPADDGADATIGSNSTDDTVKKASAATTNAAASTPTGKKAAAAGKQTKAPASKATGKKAAK